jgi:hypothetical protein
MAFKGSTRKITLFFTPLCFPKEKNLLPPWDRIRKLAIKPVSSSMHTALNVPVLFCLKAIKGKKYFKKNLSVYDSNCEILLSPYTIFVIEKQSACLKKLPGKITGQLFYY